LKSVGVKKDKLTSTMRRLSRWAFFLKAWLSYLTTLLKRARTSKRGFQGES
jgi:hypothetical protein